MPAHVRRELLVQAGAAFAIVDDGTLFLKADDAQKAEMKPGGGRPFTYAHETRGPVEMSYCSPPDTAFDDVDELLRWVRRSVALARSRKDAKKAGGPKKVAATTTSKTAGKTAARKPGKKPARKQANKPANKPATTKKLAKKSAGR